MHMHSRLPQVVKIVKITSYCVQRGRGFKKVISPACALNQRPLVISIESSSDSNSGTTSAEASVPIPSLGLPEFKLRFRFWDDSESWPESLGVSVPIPSPLLIKFPCVHNDSKAIPKLFIYKLESRFRFRFRDYLSWNIGSESDSGTTWAEISVPIPRRFRFLTRESRCFGSETREPGISG